MSKKLGAQTYALTNPPAILGYGGVGGKKESEGPLGRFFDYISEDDTFGEPTWEKAESAMQKQALSIALNRAGKAPTDLDFLLAGDLLNQCIGSAFAARSFGVPFLGLYGACSTMGESLALASLLLDGGFGEVAGALTSSHFCSAERQYRTPLEYGGQRTPTAQWTATASGAVVLTSQKGNGPRITHVTIGKVVDKGIKDANNMGAAMAPEDVKLTPCVTHIWYAVLLSTHNFSEKGGHTEKVTQIRSREAQQQSKSLYPQKCGYRDFTFRSGQF